ncbi:unnamed protein product [Allacma fusca]|uniref:Uncharacterized protein n=1 Tax=Allacma fusca TaxID=39272 RepID=A0A8J2PAM1_9HEXA|nr:unnamed protein product [Allacma fusca]
MWVRFGQRTLYTDLQGGIVAILCCFVSAHVSNTLWKKLNRSFCARQRQRQFGMNANKCSRRTPAIAYRKDQVNVSILNIPT